MKCVIFYLCVHRDRDFKEFHGLSKYLHKELYCGYWDNDKVVGVMTIAEELSFGIEMYFEEIHHVTVAIMSKAND